MAADTKLIWGFAGARRARQRCPPLPGSDVRSTEGVLAVTPSGEDSPDRVRPLRSGAPRSSAARKTGDLQLSGLHLHLRNKQRRTIPDQTENPTRPHAGEAQGIKEEMRQRRHHSIPEQ